MGEETARDIASHCGTLDTVRHATREDLMSVEGVGDVVADSVVAWFKDAENKEALAQLLK